MNYLKFVLIGFFIIGSVALIQCEGEPPGTERTEQTQNDEDDEFRRHDEGRGDDAAPGIAEGHEVEIVDDREEMIENMQELLSDLVNELEERAEEGDMETYEQVQNDQVELAQAINEAEGTDDATWEEIKEDIQETYASIATDYNERIRPEGAYGGREF